MNLILENVSFSYDKGCQWILNEVSTSISGSGLTAIMGPNGAGKTTLGKLLAGILKPTKGHVRIKGISTKALNLGKIGQQIGYLFQEPDRQIFAPTVGEELSFVLRMKGLDEETIENRTREMLKFFCLEPLREVFPFRLSRGEKQRLALASLLVHRPKFLILDEPTTALDIKGKEELKQLLLKLKAQGVGILIISHDRKFVNSLGGQMLLVKDGRIQDGSL